MSVEPTTLLPAAAAAATGIAFALGVALGASRLQDTVDIDRFRFGSSVALGMLAVDVLGVLATDQPVALAVLAVTALLSYDPSAAGPSGSEESERVAYSADVDSEDRPVDLPAKLATNGGRNDSDDGAAVGATDGGGSSADDGAADEASGRPPYL